MREYRRRKQAERRQKAKPGEPRCTIEGCEYRDYSNGLCAKHYQQQPEMRAKAAASYQRKMRDPVKKAKHRESVRVSSRKRTTGWAPDHIQHALLEQNGRCALCDTVLRLSGAGQDSLAADHDHTTGRRRGLLCGRCNKLEGYILKLPIDAAEWLRRVDAYRAKYA